MGQPVFVTGVAGFLGSHVADEMLARGYAVRGIDNMLDGFKENVPDGVDFRVSDCRDVDDYLDMLAGVEIVFHCAAAPYEGLSVFAPYMVHEHTTGATVAMLSAAGCAGSCTARRCRATASWSRRSPRTCSPAR